ncbi:MAG: Hsp20/alpha crystallin family protein [Candidatus Omnitrophica bacterium]|nr:Hsp20/alpha crystallin family protein [Candidatus Omnitrophota bacterium]
MMQDHIRKYCWLTLVFVCALVLMIPYVFAEDVQTIDVVVEGDNSQSPNSVPADNSAGGFPGLWMADPWDMMQEMHEDMRAMEERMERMFDDPFFTQHQSIFDDQGFTAESSSYYYEETDGEVILCCNIDGAVESNIDIEIKNGMISLQGMKETANQDQQQSDQGTAQVYSSSRSHFYRSFPLHENADPIRYKVEIGKDRVKIMFEKKNNGVTNNPQNAPDNKVII